MDIGVMLPKGQSILPYTFLFFTTSFFRSPSCTCAVCQIVLVVMPLSQGGAKKKYFGGDDDMAGNRVIEGGESKLDLLIKN
jgi:hypothetical protein